MQIESIPTIIRAVDSKKDRSQNEMTDKPKWHLLPVLSLALVLFGSIVACEKQAPPTPPVQEARQVVEQVIDALNTTKLLEIGYDHPEKVVTVEGVIVRTYYAKNSKGKPTFLDFHDPYEGYFNCVIWQEDKQTGTLIRDKFIEAFPPNPETYFLNKQVGVEGTIEIYKGTPEIVLEDPSQIWIVG